MQYNCIHVHMHMQCIYTCIHVHVHVHTCVYLVRTVCAPKPCIATHSFTHTPFLDKIKKAVSCLKHLWTVSPSLLQIHCWHVVHCTALCCSHGDFAHSNTHFLFLSFVGNSINPFSSKFHYTCVSGHQFEACVGILYILALYSTRSICVHVSYTCQKIKLWAKPLCQIGVILLKKYTLYICMPIIIGSWITFQFQHSRTPSHSSSSVLYLSASCISGELCKSERQQVF